MIERADLRAAVGAGILTEAQAASLASLADSRRGARENLAPGDEPFELFRGFNEIFIVVGLIILATGWAGVSVVILTEVLQSRPTNPQVFSAAVGVIGAGVIWALSEYFVRIRRMVAPSIVLSIFFALNAAGTLSAVFAQPFMLSQQDYDSLPWPLFLATLAVAVYWLRFRVPFAMAMIAVGLFVVATITAANAGGEITGVSDIFLLSAGGPFALITLVLGLAVFAVAMAFDMSDPHRVTRRSANGFWLHVVAAPALVNTIALTLLDSEAPGANGLLFLILMFIAVVAIVIDRRSFLIAAIGYVVALAATVLGGEGASFTILFLGLLLLFIGARWERIRARILKWMPGFIPQHRLPPSAF